MWSLTSPRTKRISGPEKFRTSARKDFFNSICQKATQHELKAPTGFADRQPAIAKGLSAALASQLTA
jgi:hypothetical protein